MKIGAAVGAARGASAAIAGSQVGTTVGLVAGPVGVTIGTVAGAILGGLAGGPVVVRSALSWARSWIAMCCPTISALSAGIASTCQSDRRRGYSLLTPCIPHSFPGRGCVRRGLYAVLHFKESHHGPSRRTNGLRRSSPWHGLGSQFSPRQLLEIWQREAGMDWQTLESPVRFKADTIGTLGTDTAGE
jgi:hypothetical protein